VLRTGGRAVIIVGCSGFRVLDGRELATGIFRTDFVDEIFVYGWGGEVCENAGRQKPKTFSVRITCARARFGELAGLGFVARRYSYVRFDENQNQRPSRKRRVRSSAFEHNRVSVTRPVGARVMMRLA